MQLVLIIATGVCDERFMYTLLVNMLHTGSIKSCGISTTSETHGVSHFIICSRNEIFEKMEDVKMCNFFCHQQQHMASSLILLTTTIT